MSPDALEDTQPFYDKSVMWAEPEQFEVTLRYGNDDGVEVTVALLAPAGWMHEPVVWLHEGNEPPQRLTWRARATRGPV